MVTDSSATRSGSATGQGSRWMWSPWRRSQASAARWGVIGASSNSRVSTASSTTSGPTAVPDVGLEEVHELHAGRHGGVVGPPLEVPGHPVDEPVGGPPDGQVPRGGIVPSGRVGVGLDRDGQPPDTVEEARAALDDAVGLVGPVHVVGGWPDEEVEEPERVGTDGGQVARRCHQVALGLGHLGPAHPDHALGVTAGRTARGDPRGRCPRRPAPW